MACAPATIRHAAGEREFRLEFVRISKKLRWNYAGISAVHGACSAFTHRQAKRRDAWSRAETEQVGVWDKAGFFQPCGHTPYLDGKTNE